MKQLILLLWLTCCLTVFGQNLPSTTVTLNANSKQLKVEDYKLNSKLLAREIPYRIVFPKDYKQTDKNKKYSVIYLLHGLTGHYDNWTNKTKIAEYASQYNFIIVTPEGNDGWYSDSVSIPNDKYESYIIQELIPEIDKNFNTLTDRKNRVIAGLSMGGYGSIKFGLKYPEKFVLVGSFSGALGAASFVMDANSMIGKTIMSVYGEANSQTRKDNDIFRFVKEIPGEKIKSLPFIYLDCGTEDFLIQNNRDFMNLLTEKKVPHEFRQLPGKHDWVFWDSQVKEFLEIAEKFTK
ncbi:MAG: esterase family protein [Pyrinomonadaceae bacterium]|jgi:S-formylglutathione hydrolase FrmB|nr:esterase family protein [Pyrinomonadaceae bacterium]